MPGTGKPVPEGEENKPGPRKDEKTNAALSRSFLVDPTIIAKQAAETLNARLGDTEQEFKKKSLADVQREKLAEQAKKILEARSQNRGTAQSGTRTHSPDSYHADDSRNSPLVQQGKARFEGIDGNTQSSMVPKVNLGMSHTNASNASFMSAQDTKVKLERPKWDTQYDVGGALTGRMTEEILTEHMDNLSKLEELKEDIMQINEARAKEKEERKKRLQSMHIFERLDEVRESRILTRHEKRQREWDEFRSRMVSKLGKERDPDNLVFNRAEEWRAMLEEKELLMKAQPIEQRQGSNLWQMSLRDAWTRYVSVGGPFSGLEMPFIDRPELRPDSIYTIRNPFNETASYADQVLIDPHTGKPRVNEKTKQPLTRKDLGISTHPSLNLDKSRKSRAHLPDEQAPRDAAKRRLANAVTILKPAEVMFDGLCILGEGFETRFKAEQAAEEERLAQQEIDRLAEEAKQEAKQRRKAMNRKGGSTRGASMAGNSMAMSEAATSQSGKSAAMAGAVGAAAAAAEDAGMASAMQGIEVEPWVPEENEPSMSFEQSRLVMHVAEAGKSGQAVLSTMNVGNCAVYYSWSRVQVGVEAARDKLQRFFMKDLSGSLVPGGSKDFVFTFKPEKPGLFAEEWTFHGTPNVGGCQHKVLVKGVCTAADASRAKRAQLEARLAEAERDHTVEEMLHELVDHIGTPRTKPRVLAEDPDVDRQVFIAQNKEAQIYYSNTTLKLFRSLADSMFELLNFPMELRKWDSSLKSLKRLLYAIEDDYERERHIVEYNEIMKNAGIPPTSTAMFNSICYELVSELADSIPDLADSIRNKLSLKKKNLQPKREDTGEEVEGAEFGMMAKIVMEERMLTYTTEPPPPKGAMDLWHYDNHLLRIGGPPVEWFYKEGEEPRKDPLTGEDRVGTIKLKKKVMVEMWSDEEKAAATDEGAEGEEAAVKMSELDKEDQGRLEFEYLLRLNDGVYYKLACMTERMALLNVEADLRSQVIAQVVIELNEAAANEMRTLIKEDKVDEARKIDPAKYQNIVDLDQIFRQVMKEEAEAEARRVSAEREKAEAEARTAQARAAGGGSLSRVGSVITSVPAFPPPL